MADDFEGSDARIARLEAEINQLRSRLAQDAPVSVREALLVEAERAAHLGSWMWDLRTQKVFWSDELFRILGRDPSLDQASPDAFFAAVHPDDVARVRAAADRSLALGAAERVEFRVVRRTGELRHLVMDGAILREQDGQIARVVGSCLDVTERRRSEAEAERASALLELTERLTGVGVFAWQPETGSLLWSDELLRIFASDAPLGPDAFLAAVVEEDLPQVVRMQKEVPIMGVAGPVAFRIRRPGGELRHLLMTAKATGAGIRGSIVDITERIRLEERVHHAQKLDAIGRLAGGVAHDFNNLLAVISANASVLALELGSNGMLQEVMQAADQAAAMTKQLLAISRNQSLERRPIDLGALIAGALGLLRRMCAAGVTLTFSAPEEPCWVLGDESQLHQVLLNLVVNARDALPHGGHVEIALSASRQSPAPLGPDARDAPMLQLLVKDDGQGMDEATRARIFEPFFTTKQPGSGTGLGLATVLGIVKQHGGSIEVSSQVGQGTSFRVLLPALPPPAP